MNEMNDNNIDTLIRETFERRQLVADLDRLIIADIQSRARRAWIRRWARVLVFSFGIPMMLLIFAACTYLYIKHHGASALTLFTLAWPTLALIYITHKAFRTFSPEQV